MNGLVGLAEVVPGTDPGWQVWLAVILALIAMFKDVIKDLVAGRRESAKPADPLVSVVIENTKAIQELTGVLKVMADTNDRQNTVVVRHLEEMQRVLQGVDYRTKEILKRVEELKQG